MTVAALSVSPEPVLSIAADVLVVAVASSEAGPTLLSDLPEVLELQGSLAAIGVTGAVDEITRLPFAAGGTTSIALVGVGSATLPVDALRAASGTAARQLRGIDSLLIALPVASDDELLAVLEGAALGSYAYTQYRSSTLESTKLPAAAIIVASAHRSDADLVARATIVATAVHTVRDLVNAPPRDLYPETLADATVAHAAHAAIDVTVYDEAALVDGGFGGILSVGQGSSRAPRLVKVSYNPAGARKHLALVGKGITFDSGGLSLKPAASMLTMKTDMTGAATVMAVAVAAADLALPVRITAWMCIAENLPSGTATRPDDVVRIYGGKTVENLNTDAEGRIVLADGLVAASEENPDAIIDVATLTGAQVVALGNRTTGVMGDEQLVERVVATAKTVGEPFWPMPIPGEMRALLNSDIADIANVKPGNTAGGMLVAASFLRDFVGTTGEGDDKRQIPWAHLDIAGPSYNSAGGYGFTGKGATGVTVRTLIAVAEDFSRA
ncbi:leucyl aminopeptidase [Conyzicola nivalis]|uniref:Probable cytosol aminopeptidase n=1 Tax=Conyzicola nivalis TaxID=1477021 RepID=A0A916WHA8_9MICO|nr:leucyl aminopeptidase [Conyzicola nivalis]GGA97071.1 putative cytosol aminopeptidase [Conyzicola nivalis]